MNELTIFPSTASGPRGLPRSLRRRLADLQQVVIRPVAEHRVDDAEQPTRHRHDLLLAAGARLDRLIDPLPRAALPYHSPRRLPQGPPQQRRPFLGDAQVLPLAAALAYPRRQPRIGG